MLDASIKATGVEEKFNYEDIEIDRHKVYEHIMAKKDEENKNRNQKFE